MTDFSNFLKAWIRTLAPILVGWLIGLGVLPDDLSAMAVAGFDALIMAGYYTLARLAEKYVNPWFGVLLGVPSQPAYTPVSETLYREKK